MEYTSVTAPESKFVLTHVATPTPAPNLFGWQTEKEKSVSLENSDLEMKRVNDNTSYGDIRAAYSTIDIEKSDICDSKTDASLISLDHPLVPQTSNPMKLTPGNISFRTVRSLSPIVMNDDSRFECIIAQQFSTPNVSPGREISAFGLSPIDVKDVKDD